MICLYATFLVKKKCQNLFIVFVIIFAQKKLLYLYTFKSILALIKGHKLSAPEIQ